MNQLQTAAKIIVTDCLSVKPEETVLVVVDKPLKKIGQAIFKAAEEVEAEVVLTEMLPRQNHGEEPPKVVAEAMKEAEVVIMPTSKSLSHTKARIEACKQGARAATLPTITEEIMNRTLTADYEAISNRSRLLAEKLTAAEKAQVTAPNGTEITCSLQERAGHADTGIYHQAGEFGNLPAGEAYIAPLEGTSEGKFVIDGSIAGAEAGTEDIELIVEAGYVVEINGGQAAAKLREMVGSYGKEAYNIAELGIGTNDQAKLTGNVLEDEKVMGTVHIAIGDNSTIGGEISVSSHLDGIIEQPTVKLDGDVIMKEGELIVNAE
jgi:leucyl aminopeptidase (aminopeptidase T)